MAITAKKDDKEFTLLIGNEEITVNGQTVIFDVPPQIIGNRTLAPVRAVSESFGVELNGIT